MSVDDLIDDVVGFIEQQGLADNTYFLYSSDHGKAIFIVAPPAPKWIVAHMYCVIPFVKDTCTLTIDARSIDRAIINRIPARGAFFSLLSFSFSSLSLSLSLFFVYVPFAPTANPRNGDSTSYVLAR
jgi:arylsulfatase A-like enzyme